MVCPCRTDVCRRKNGVSRIFFTSPRTTHGNFRQSFEDASYKAPR